jgi:hypothetical protein
MQKFLKEAIYPHQDGKKNFDRRNKLPSYKPTAQRKSDEVPKIDSLDNHVMFYQQSQEGFHGNFLIFVRDDPSTTSHHPIWIGLKNDDFLATNSKDLRKKFSPVHMVKRLS